MATVVFEYNENDRTASGMFGVIAVILVLKAFLGRRQVNRTKELGRKRQRIVG